MVTAAVQGTPVFGCKCTIRIAEMSCTRNAAGTKHSYCAAFSADLRRMDPSCLPFSLPAAASDTDTYTRPRELSPPASPALLTPRCAKQRVERVQIVSLSIETLCDSARTPHDYSAAAFARRPFLSCSTRLQMLLIQSC